MLGIMVGVGFVGMVLAPCAIAIYSKMGSNAEAHEAAEQAVAEPVAAVVAPPPEFAEEDVRSAESVQEVARPVSAPVRVPSLREVAEMAAREAVRAQALAAQANLNALQEASREAAKRATAASKLAEAAERELVRATQAAMQAEALKARAKLTVENSQERDYLPADHPSLDFPRSRVQPRRVA